MENLYCWFCWKDAADVEKLFPGLNVPPSPMDIEILLTINHQTAVDQALREMRHLTPHPSPYICNECAKRFAEIFDGEN
jgi:hypothetical protein